LDPDRYSVYNAESGSGSVSKEYGSETLHVSDHSNVIRTHVDNIGARVAALVDPCRLSGRTPQSRQSAKRFSPVVGIGTPPPL
jgi:hypothetical protein